MLKVVVQKESSKAYSQKSLNRVCQVLFVHSQLLATCNPSSMTIDYSSASYNILQLGLLITFSTVMLSSIIDLNYCFFESQIFLRKS